MATTTIAAPPQQAPVETERKESAPRQNKAGWLFSAPFIVVYTLFLIGPIIVGLVTSFFNTTTVTGGLGQYVGGSNYGDVLGDSAFWRSMWHSAVFTLFTTPILVLLPLLFAILVSRIKHGTAFYRLAFFAPYVVPSAAVALIFAWMYTPEIGLITKAASWLGLGTPNFLGSTSGGWFAVVLMTVWWTFGFNFILYTAAIQDIPRELYEAASLDGAGPVQQIFRITLPLLARTTTLVVVLQVIASLKIFDQIFIMTSGGPNFSTIPALEYVYDQSFSNMRIGYGSAVSMLLFLLIFAVSFVWFRISSREEGGV
jgi:multiple sugar transport system permease protein